jgi:GNAT superfamily N-acetyltransferase
MGFDIIARMSFPVGQDNSTGTLPIKRFSLYHGYGKDSIMPELNVYQQLDFPALYKWQAIAFMRMEWASIFYDDNLYMSETYPPELQPVHFVMAENDSLLSYASLLKLNLSHAGMDYSIYGFGNLLTFPPYRRRGYGGQILQAATNYIQQSDVDAAVLFCDPLLEGFYQAKGWTCTQSPTRLGSPNQYREYEPSRMMLFVSQKGIHGKADFETQPIYIDWPW